MYSDVDVEKEALKGNYCRLLRKYSCFCLKILPPILVVSVVELNVCGNIAFQYTLYVSVRELGFYLVTPRCLVKIICECTLIYALGPPEGGV
jgi:hypothetical protein